jgi:hypothetical protein
MMLTFTLNQCVQSCNGLRHFGVVATSRPIQIQRIELIERMSLLLNFSASEHELYNRIISRLFRRKDR